MPSGKRKKIDLCKECKSSALPAISAAKLGHVQCLTVAYRDLGVFNERDDFGATPIHFAARNGQMECLVWLVTRSGISPNGASSNGATPAHDAAAMGHLDCLQYLLRNTRCSANDVTQEGATALHMACRFGRLKVVQWLMEFSGASPGVKGANDVTPVHLCAARGEVLKKGGGAGCIYFFGTMLRNCNGRVHVQCMYGCRVCPRLRGAMLMCAFFIPWPNHVTIIICSDSFRAWRLVDFSRTLCIRKCCYYILCLP